VRENIIPEELVMAGTIRTLDTQIQTGVHEKIKLTAEKIAESVGATATVEIDKRTPVTYNTPELVKKMLPALEKAIGKENIIEAEWVMGAEDFAFYGAKAPAFFFFVGGMPKGKNVKDSAPHHTPDFFIDDSRLDVGVKAFANIVMDFKMDGRLAKISQENDFAGLQNEQILIQNCRQPNFFESPFQPFRFSVLLENDLARQLCRKS